MIEFDELIGALSHRGIGWETFTLVACLASAYGICWLTGRRQPPESVLYGRYLVDGLLFPLVALALTYFARVGLGGLQEVPLLRLALPVLVSLAGIRLLARVFTLVFPRSKMARTMERVFSWLAWIAAVLWIMGLLPAVLAELEGIRFSFGKGKISLLSIVQGALSSGLVLVLALWLSAALERKVLRDAVTDLSLRKVAVNAVRAMLLAVGFLFALSAAGVDLTALSVLGGAFGVGLGFGMQKLAANYVSGFVILAERSLRIGDMVKVDGFEGVVADIKTRYTLIRAGDGRASVVPNEKLISERVENLSIADPRVLVTTDVAVAYDSNAEQVQALLVDAAMRTQRVLADPPPSARLVSFGADGLEFRLFFWIDDPQNGQVNVRSDVNLKILRALREAGIDIPYPQRVLHVPRGTVTLNASGTEATG
ncbi:mechanosensitive ion channel [Ramlibacter sp. USB13]|uniref:Mechanosensitive ion channel n=1 Tax=Ramlibacter cellulosilyticus TaxID=2764187 RepID=A0A923MPF0_9BURK|nr:mechanosensitive ion channel domain-containing protein [Ramlibacter cellulosilyticus]MBC5782466.1 mechanosensitive ion channel [Ramlibacter cellulosilyticus]